MAITRNQYLAGAAAKRAVKAMDSLDVQVDRLGKASTEKSRIAAWSAIEKKSATVREELQNVINLSAQA